MASLFNDLRFGLRMMIRNPVFSLIAIVTLALGIGANTAIFSVVDAVLLRPLPYPGADRLVFLWSTMNSQGVPMSGSALPDYHEWRNQSKVFDGLGAFYYGDFNLAATGEAPERIQGAYVTANLFQVLQVAPALGRPFAPEEEQSGKHRVVLISDSLWQRRFGGNASVIGREIRLAGESYIVAGVMPRGMPFFDNLPEVELWTPMAFAKDDNMATRNNHFINLVGRLKPGVTTAQAQSDVSVIARAMEEVEPGNKGLGGLIVPLQEQMAGDSRMALLVLLGAVGFVLLVACVNVANLLLARASARSKELAIRASLGASRRRIVCQVIVECLPLAFIGGLCGLLLATWGIELISSFLPDSLPRGNEIGVNARVLSFTFVIALLTIVIFGLLPALQAVRTDLRDSMNEGGNAGLGSRKQGRVRRVLIVAEVALALVLLVGSGLMLRAFMKLRQVDVGFNARNVVTLRVPLPEAKYPFATTATELPLGRGFGWGKLMSIEDQPAPASLNQVPSVNFGLVSSDYFRTFGIAVLHGRSFNSGDHGVMVTAVAQRTHEIGLRMALGAQGRDVLWLVIRQGMFPVLLGVGVGLAAAVALTRLMSTLLYEVSATDPLVTYRRERRRRSTHW